MLRAGTGKQRTSSSRLWNLVVFSVGGRRFAVKADEVTGISKWKGSIPVPSRTPFISAVIRQEDAVWPVFDLAELLHVSVRGDCLLCLMAKHPRGAMAICIDEDMPVLRTLDVAAVGSNAGMEVPSIGSFTSSLEEIPILSLSKLGSASH